MQPEFSSFRHRQVVWEMLVHLKIGQMHTDRCTWTVRQGHMRTLNNSALGWRNMFCVFRILEQLDAKIETIEGMTFVTTEVWSTWVLCSYWFWSAVCKRPIRVSSHQKIGMKTLSQMLKVFFFNIYKWMRWDWVGNLDELRCLKQDKNKEYDELWSRVMRAVPKLDKSESGIVVLKSEMGLFWCITNNVKSYKKSIKQPTSVFLHFLQRNIGHARSPKKMEN